MSNQYDVLIKGATIVDGSASPAYEGHVAVKGERIVAVGNTAGAAAKTIDGAGLVVCPGFVDPHSHADRSILLHPQADNLVMQGITTFVGGNCGSSMAPLRDPAPLKESMTELGTDLDVDWRTFNEWLSRVEATGISPNYAPLVGHDNIRNMVLGEDFKREATPGEIKEMQRYVREAMESGAFGLSSFADPGPGEYAALDEFVQLARVVGEYNGLYVPHTRHIQSQWASDDTEEFGYGIFHGPVEDAWVGRYRGYLEAIEISRRSQTPLHIAHLSSAYRIPQPHPAYLDSAAARATLEIIDDAREGGVDVTFDTLACSSSISGQVPLLNAFADWLDDTGKAGLVDRVKTSAFRQELHSLDHACRLKLGMIHTKADPYWMDCFKIEHCANRTYEGKTLGEIASSQGTDPLDTLCDIFVQDPDTVWRQFLDKRFLPAAIPVLLSHPLGMPGTDTIYVLPARLPDDFKVSGYGLSPITYGLYPHYLATYVRETGSLSLEQAVQKATSMPADRFGIVDRGRLRPGAYADIVLFDLETIGLKGDFANPAQPPEGIACVLINGQVVYQDMEHTDARPGQVLRHQWR